MSACGTGRCPLSPHLFGHNWPPLATRRSKCLVESRAFASESHTESTVDVLCRRTGQCNFPALCISRPHKFNISALDPFSSNMLRRELATIKGTQTLHHSLLAELGTQRKPRGAKGSNKHPMQKNSRGLEGALRASANSSFSMEIASTLNMWWRTDANRFLKIAFSANRGQN